MKPKRKRYKLPTTLNTTSKDKTKNVSQQQLIKNAARRTKLERSERHQTQIPPLNPEERGMSGPEPPPSEVRLHGWLFIVFIASRISGDPLRPPRGAAPRRLRPCESPQPHANSQLTAKKDLFIRNTCLWHSLRSCRHPGEKFG